MGVFVECHDNVHAGVIMELISGGESIGTARPLLRSTLTRQLHRVPAHAIGTIPGDTPEDLIHEIVASLECDCAIFYPDDERNLGKERAW